MKARIKTAFWAALVAAFVPTAPALAFDHEKDDGHEKRCDPADQPDDRRSTGIMSYLTEDAPLSGAEMDEVSRPFQQVLARLQNA